MYDVCIVGAGPAGATLARLIGGRYRALLVDKRPLSGGAAGESRKVCGGLIAPAAQRELARQGLGVPGSVLLGPQLYAVRTVDVRSGLDCHYQRFYTNVDRSAFDSWLLSLVPESVDRLDGWSAVGWERDGDSHVVRFGNARGGRAGVRARVIVGADGARSWVRRHALSCTTQPTTYAAVQGIFEAAGTDAHYGAIFDERVTDYYGWAIPKADTLVIGVALRGGENASERFETFVDSVRDTGFRLGQELRREAAPLVRPSSLRDLRLGSDGVLLIGEAAALISPSSGEGISYALRSAAAAASALESGLKDAHATYARAVAPVALEVLGKIAKGSVIGAPRARRLVMRAGIGAMPAHPSGQLSEAFGL